MNFCLHYSTFIQNCPNTENKNTDTDILNRRQKNTDSCNISQNLIHLSTTEANEDYIYNLIQH